MVDAPAGYGFSDSENQTVRMALAAQEVEVETSIGVNWKCGLAVFAALGDGMRSTATTRSFRAICSSNWEVRIACFAGSISCGREDS